MREVEVKFYVKNFNKIRPQLKKLGARLIWKGIEENYFFDTPKDDLRKKGQRLRIKKLPNHSDTLTLKGPSPKSERRHKVRDEREIAISSSQVARGIIQNLGFIEVLRYKKYREHWKLGNVSLELDKLKNKYFAEIEGSKKDIDRVAKLLNLDWAQSTTKTYITILKEL